MTDELEPEKERMFCACGHIPVAHDFGGGSCASPGCPCRGYAEHTSKGEARTALDPSDPFDAALIEMSQLHRKKRADYAADEDRWSNFRTTAGLLGMAEFGTQEAIEVNIAQKMARLQSLRLNGRMADPQNESVLDTRRDLAVYAVLSLVYATHEQWRVTDDDID